MLINEERAVGVLGDVWDVRGKRSRGVQAAISPMWVMYLGSPFFFSLPLSLRFWTYNHWFGPILTPCFDGDCHHKQKSHSSFARKCAVLLLDFSEGCFYPLAHLLIPVSK